MKIFKKIYIVAFAIFIIAVGCESMLDVDSDKILVYDENDLLDLPNDTLYSMVGIFTKLQKVAERYIVLGEVRGDLMTISDDAPVSLVEVANHNISLDNQYNNIRDYYSIINNCNYLITMADTAKTYRVKQIYKREYAAALAIRAWTYMQILQTYGEVTYYDKPILSTDDLIDNEDNVLTTPAELVATLAPQLEEVKDVEMPDYGYFNETDAGRLIFPVRCVLGDLYLLNNNYKEAADAYYEFIVDEELTIYEGWQDQWSVVNGEFTEKNSMSNGDGNYSAWYWSYEDFAPVGIYFWANFYLSANYDPGRRSGSKFVSTYLGSTRKAENGSRLYDLFYKDNFLLPSEIAKTNWDKEIYYHDSLSSIEGDFRGRVNSYATNDYIAYGETRTVIRKIAYEGHTLNELQEFVPIYRTTQLYLRFAEAVNRAGKPNLAYAVLKCGLNSSNLSDTLIIPQYEDISDYPFNNGLIFSNNVGVHELGCGNVSKVNDYKIPELASLDDSILFVEDAIMHELTLETAFEGNRFNDLMRVAKRRENTDYLADKVAAKYGANAEAIRILLQDEENWYLNYE